MNTSPIRVPASTVKIYKKHSFRIIFTGILSLLIIGLCVALCFLPIVSISCDVLATPTTYTFKVIDLAKDFFLGQHSSYQGILDYIDTLGSTGGLPMGVLKTVFNVFFIFIPVMFLVIALHALFLLIFAFKSIIAGRLKNLKGPTSFSRAITFCLLLVLGFNIALNFLLPKLSDNYMKISDVLYSYLFLGGAILIWVLLHSIYYLGLKNRYCSKDVQPADNEPTIMNSYAPLISGNNEIASSAYAQGNSSTGSANNGNLPTNITFIGGHSFAANMNLTTAIIPEGIPSIGEAAFANCGNLTMLSIPKSVRDIGPNAMFNCRNLKKIIYSGTKMEWSNINRGSNWLLQCGTNLVSCIDGTIVVDPLK